MDIIDFNKDNIKEQLFNLEKYLNNKSKDIKFKIITYDFYQYHIIEFKVNIEWYHYEGHIRLEVKDFIPIENIIECLKYHIFDGLCKKVGLDKL